MESGCSLNIRPIEYTVGLDVECERKKKIKDNSMLFSLSDLNKRVVLNSDGKTVCEIGFGEKIKISLLDMCNLRCLLISVQFSSIIQSHPTLCDPTDCSTPGLPVYHKLLEFTQTHVH